MREQASGVPRTLGLSSPNLSGLNVHERCDGRSRKCTICAATLTRFGVDSPRPPVSRRWVARVSSASVPATAMSSVSPSAPSRMSLPQRTSPSTSPSKIGRRGAFFALTPVLAAAALVLVTKPWRSLHPEQALPVLTLAAQKTPTGWRVVATPTAGAEGAASDVDGLVARAYTNEGGHLRVHQPDAAVPTFDIAAAPDVTRARIFVGRPAVLERVPATATGRGLGWQSLDLGPPGP